MKKIYKRRNMHVLAAMALLLIFGVEAALSGVVVVDNNDLDNNVMEEEQKAPANGFDVDWINMVNSPPSKIFQKFGYPVEIVCEVMGSQRPKIHWVVRHLPMPEVDSVETNEVTPMHLKVIARVRSVHIIDRMLKEPRSYTCIGRSGSNTVSASTTVYPEVNLRDMVQLRDRPFNRPTKPRIVYTEKLHLEYMGADVVLPCRVYARPAAQIEWLDEDKKSVGTQERFTISPLGDLLIANVTWPDMGVYYCVAHNSFGKDIAETFIYPVLME